MTMFRQSPPEYRALVVENEREFRGDLIYTIESMDIGISVVGEASDYDDARALIDSGEVDLLVTDINLTDEPRFKVGDQDGTELAQYARDRYDIPCIFLTAFADYDPEVVTRAAATDPIGFIQKQGSEVGVQTQHLIRLALRRLELIRRERETTGQLQSIVDQLGKAILYVDLDGQILDFNTGAVDLLQQPGETLIDQHWEDVIRVEGPAGSGNPLRPLISSGVSARLPVLALTLPDGESALISVRLAQTEHLREPCTLLVIRELRDQATGYGALKISPNTAVLAFGLEQDTAAGEFNEAQLRIMMLALQATLLEGIRTQDEVSRPMDTISIVRLPDTDEATGYGIACTLHAAVESRMKERYPDITLRAGLAHRDAGRSANATLAAALEALDRAQHSLETPVLSASTAASIHELSLRSERPHFDQSVLGFAFGVTAKILDIPTEAVTTPGEFGSHLGENLKDFEEIRAFGVCLINRDGVRNWAVYQQRSGEAFVNAAANDVDLTLESCVADQQFTAMSSLSFYQRGDVDISLIALRRDTAFFGFFLLETNHDDGVRFRPSNDDEKQLARIAGEHLARIVQRTFLNNKATSGEAAEIPNTYNPYGLRSDFEPVATAALLLKLNVAISVVGETGMGRAKLLQHAALHSRCDAAEKIRIESSSRWQNARQIKELRALLRTTENTLLVMRDPQLMHPALQEELATAVRTKSVSDGARGDTALAPFRFAATLPTSPQTLTERGELHADLASALGAGVIYLYPLRENSREMLTWAQLILAKEAATTGRGTLEFDAAAGQALKRHPWPGNLEELADRIKDAVARCPREEISALDLGLFQLQTVNGGEDRQERKLDSVRGDYGAQQLRATLLEVVEICIHISEPPVIGRWLEDELVTQVLERYRADKDPVSRGAEFLGINRARLREHASRAGFSSGERLSSAFWQSVRLAVRNWLDGMHGFEENFENVLQKHTLDAILAKRPPIGEERALLIAGCSAEDYRAHEEVISTDA